MVVSRPMSLSMLTTAARLRPRGARSLCPGPNPSTTPPATPPCFHAHYPQNGMIGMQVVKDTCSVGLQKSPTRTHKLNHTSLSPSCFKKQGGEARRAGLSILYSTMQNPFLLLLSAPLSLALYLDSISTHFHLKSERSPIMSNSFISYNCIFSSRVSWHSAHATEHTVAITAPFLLRTPKRDGISDKST
jgi:hypothetical protein